MRLQKLLAVVGLCALTGSALLNAQIANVSITLTLDNEYALFAVDPNTNQLTLIASDSDWFSTETHNFSAPIGSYIYVAGRDTGVAAMFVSRTTIATALTVFTVTTGISNPNTNWEVNSWFRPLTDNFSLTDVNEVLNWGNEWEAPVVGRRVFGPGDFAHAPGSQDPHFPFLSGAFHIWKSPGGGNAYPNTWRQWGFEGYTEEGSVLFRLQVVPEPASLLVLGAGLAGLAGLKRRKR